MVAVLGRLGSNPFELIRVGLFGWLGSLGHGRVGGGGGFPLRRLRETAPVDCAYLRPPLVLVSLVVLGHLVLTWIFFGLTFSALATSTVSTPASNLASTLPGSTCGGSVTARLNEPYRRSIRW